MKEKTVCAKSLASATKVFQSNFPERNRLMAAISDATVIFEASDTSGSLHQAVECVRLDRWLFIAESLTENPFFQRQIVISGDVLCRCSLEVQAHCNCTPSARKSCTSHR